MNMDMDQLPRNRTMSMDQHPNTGYWQKTVPLKSGLYFVATREGVPAGQRQVTYLFEGAPQPCFVQSDWAGWWWSEPVAAPNPPKPDAWQHPVLQVSLPAEDTVAQAAAQEPEPDLWISISKAFRAHDIDLGSGTWQEQIHRWGFLTAELRQERDAARAELAACEGALDAQRSAIQDYCDSENAMRVERDLTVAAIGDIERKLTAAEYERDLLKRKTTALATALDKAKAQNTKLASISVLRATSESLIETERAAALKAAYSAAAEAKLPDGYQWGRDALEAFHVGTRQAAAAIRALTLTPALLPVLDEETVRADERAKRDVQWCTALCYSAANLIPLTVEQMYGAVKYVEARARAEEWKRGSQEALRLAKLSLDPEPREVTWNELEPSIKQHDERVRAELEGDGSPTARWELLLDQLEARFPDPTPHRSDEIPETHYVRAIDELLALVRIARKLAEGLDEHNWDCSCMRMGSGAGPCDCDTAKLRALLATSAAGVTTT